MTNIDLTTSDKRWEFYIQIAMKYYLSHYWNCCGCGKAYPGSELHGSLFKLYCNECEYTWMNRETTCKGCHRIVELAHLHVMNGKYYCMACKFSEDLRRDPERGIKMCDYIREKKIPEKETKSCEECGCPYPTSWASFDACDLCGRLLCHVCEQRTFGKYIQYNRALLCKKCNRVFGPLYVEQARTINGWMKKHACTM